MQTHESVTHESAPRSKASVDRFNREVFPEGWKMNVHPATETPVRQKGMEYLDTKQDLLLALCLNNGYYNRENIYRMLKFATAFSKSVQVFTTDGPARHNYRAFGQPESKIVRDARLDRNHLQNLAKSGLERLNTELSPENQKSISFVQWDGIYDDPIYQASLAHLKNLYETNAEFKADVDATTTKVLLSRVGINRDTEAILAEGIQYVLEEVAFIVAYRELSAATKPVPEHGSEGFNYIYYEPWPVLEKLINGEYDGQHKEGIGFVVARIESAE